MTLSISERMSRVRGINTGPELEIRKLLSSYGVRYRLQRKDLPGKPDLYVPRLRLAIFVNGCFWHGHEDCPRAALPKTNTTFWANKISQNVARDRRVEGDLRSLGFDFILVWTCDAKNFPRICERIARRWMRRAPH